jgi:tetratricopeptide (TPR) repeat protein
VALDQTSLKVVLYRIEENPLDPVAWRDLVKAKSPDNLVRYCVEVAAQGIEQLSKKEPVPELSAADRLVFARLARASNNPNYIVEAGLIYLEECGMPETALQHFQLALGYLPGHEDILQCMNRAEELLRQQQAARNDSAPRLKGAVSEKPKAAALLRQTGKLSTRVRPDPITASRPAGPVSALPELVSDPQIEGYSTDELLGRAARFLEQRNFAEAEQYCGHALKRKLDSETAWNAWTALGSAYFSGHKIRQAVCAYQEARNLKPNNLASLFNLGVALQEAGEYQEALRCYFFAEQISENNPKILCNRGVVYFQLDDLPQAEASLRAAIGARPDYVRAWDNLASVLAAQNRMDEALEACREAARCNPEHTETWFKLGVIYFQREEYEPAQEAFEKARGNETLTSYITGYLSLIASHKGQVEEAMALAEESKAQGLPHTLSWVVWNELAVMLMAEKKHERAAWAGREAILAKPDEFSVWFNLGLAYQQLAQWPDAQESFETAATLRPEAAWAWQNLGEACLATYEYDRAARALRKAIELTPREGPAWHLLAKALKSDGKTEQAREAEATAKALDEEIRVSEARITKALDMIPKDKTLWAKVKRTFNVGG